jgi:REP element-mobilizing transposase RayT
MARPLRIELPGAVYHVTSRGNARLPIFENNGDKKLFLFLLNQVVDHYHWLCHGYCLMDNHYHLLIETVEANLSIGMRQLNGTYTQSFNRFHNRVGHLFQGRFKSIIVERDTYLLELCRYIVLNPVRALMVSSPGKYSWSSYKATAGLIKSPTFLTIEWILKHFGSSKQEAQKQYRSFVGAGIDQPSPWESLKAQCLLGGEQFIGSLKQSLTKSQKLSEIPKKQRFFSRPNLSELFNSNCLRSKIERNQAIQQAFFTHRYTQTEIAAHLGMHYSTISRLLRGKKSK